MFCIAAQTTSGKGAEICNEWTFIIYFTKHVHKHIRATRPTGACARPPDEKNTL
jgi:hypothetical protein